MYMLTKLLVHNYALIRDLEIKFDRGFTILTGETGAGKSIIFGALSLILGKRADTAALLDKNEKCVVEGVFDIGGIDPGDFFENNDLDKLNPTIIRREISTGGRSRAFINDTPVTLDQLKILGGMLIDIHSQHQNLLLGSNHFQLNLVDSFAEHYDLLANYTEAYNSFKQHESEFRKLSENRDKNVADLDYYSYQLKQLDDENLIEGEEKNLEEEQELLTHAGEIHDALEGSSLLINGEDFSAVDRLNEVRRLIERIEEYYPDAKVFLERLESTIIELNDLGNEMDSRSSDIESDPSRLEAVNSRLDSLNALMQKHRVEDTRSLIKKKEELRDIVSGIETSDERLSELEKLLAMSRERTAELATELSNNRKEQLPLIENEMNRLLIQLGIPNGRFKINISGTENFTPAGRDQVEFLFSANRQAEPENLARVASGGELSRVMLSLKSLLSDNKSLPTIFFDEIDAGVSGEVATKVASILAAMGKKMQVINITHLPQVAAYGTMHYHVYKEDEDESTITRIKLLDKKERLEEIARLLSGNEITKASIENAKELMREA